MYARAINPSSGSAPVAPVQGCVVAGWVRCSYSTPDTAVLGVQDQKMEVVETLPQRQPVDTQAVCDLSANPDDNTQYEIDI